MREATEWRSKQRAQNFQVTFPKIYRISVWCCMSFFREFNVSLDQYFGSLLKISIIFFPSSSSFFFFRFVFVLFFSTTIQFLSLKLCSHSWVD